ncbi:MAG: HEAT repeat domain-containing protein [Melioribacteraceae bacterium]|nr:MAG: HEAT repeat domain-containing protein [Melioribacteraceae bacterium]
MSTLSELTNFLEQAEPQQKIELLQQISTNELADEILELLLSILTDQDKGVRNSITILLANSNDDRIPAILVKYISSADIAARNLAGEILVMIGSPSVTPLLDYLNGNTCYDDQKFIIDLLGLIKDKSAEEPILEILRKTEDGNVKLSCLEALGNIKSEKAVDLAMKCYEEDELYKPTVNEALGKIGSKKALDFMIAKYPEEDELTKFAIIESLGLIGNVDTFFFLISELHSANGPLIWVLVNSIASLKDKLDLDVPYDEKVRNAILNTLYEAQPEFKKAAILLLKEFNDKEILTAALTTLGDDFELDEILRVKVLENKEHALIGFSSLLKMDLKNAGNILGLLSEVIDSIDEPISKILNGLQVRSLIDSLSSYLDHPDEEARRLTMNLLFKIDYKTAVLFADKMLSDDNLWNKIRLIDNLAEINDEIVNPLLQQLSKDNEVMVSERAADLLDQKTSIYN